MKFDNQITAFLLNSKFERAIELWKKTLQLVVRSDPEKWTYTQFNNFYGAMEYVLNIDPFIKGVVNKRLHLVKSYEYSVTEHFERFVLENNETFFKILYNMIFFGKCLLNITDEAMGFKIKIIPPQEYYVKDGDIIFLIDEEYNKRQMLYLGSDLVDVSAIGLSIVAMSIEKELNRYLWLNNNRFLGGFIHSSISTDLANEAKPEENMQAFSDNIVNKIERLSETGGVLNTPEGIDIQYKETTNNNAGNSYKEYINQTRTELENIILGRSTQQNDTTYASEKIRYMATNDIQFADVKTLEHIINSILVHVKWRNGWTDMKSRFKIEVAVDEDELTMIQVLNGVKNLGAVDSNGQPLQVDSKWLSDILRIPFNNTGNLILTDNRQSTNGYPPQRTANNTPLPNNHRKSRICVKCGDEFLPSYKFQRKCDSCKKQKSS